MLPLWKGPRALCTPPPKPVSSGVSYLLLQRLRGHPRVSDVGLLRTRWLVQPGRSLTHGVTSRIRRLDFPCALRHVGRFGAVPPPVPTVVRVLVPALLRRVAIAGLRGPGWRRGVPIVGPTGLLWRSVLRGAGRAGRRGRVGLAGPHAAVV